MHIEPGLVDASKIALSYATAAGALGYAAKLSWDTLKTDGWHSGAVVACSHLYDFGVLLL